MDSIRYDVRQPVLSRQGACLMYCGVSRYDSSWGSVMHSHAHAELFYATRGRGCLQIADELIPLETGACFLINPYVMHTEMSTAQEPLEYIVIGLNRVAFEGDSASHPRYLLIDDRDNQRAMLPYFQDLLRELSTERESYLEVCADIADVLLRKIGRRARMAVYPEDTARISSECAEAKRLIDEHFQEDVTLDWLAQQAGISKFYLSRTFRAYYSISPMQYLCQRRIHEARHLLATTDPTQDAIAMLCGFSSPSYFSQAFKRVAGQNPSEYRRAQRGADAHKAGA